MKRICALVAALGSLMWTDVVWAAPPLQVQVSEGQMTLAVVMLILLTIGCVVFVWKFYPREDKDSKDKK